MRHFQQVFVSLAAAGLCALSMTPAHANVEYFAMPVNYDGSETDTLFVYGVAGTTGTVSSPNGFSSAFTVAANGVTSVVIPNSYDLTTSGLVTNNGFVVQTTNPSANIGASYLSRETATTDTTYLFNSSALGTSYYAVGAPALSTLSSQLTIVGTAAGTTVTITPSTGGFTSGQTAGVPFNVTLGAGQAVVFNSSTDVSGSYITSSAPIAVFGGAQCANVPSTATACDHTLTALPSVDRYTTNAIVPTTFGVENPSSNLVRVLAATNGTQVFNNGVLVATLNAGQFADFRSGAGALITSNNPVLINTYLTGQSEHGSVAGDPAQSYVPGIAQWLKDYVFSTPVGTQAYSTNFLDIAIRASDIGSLLLNGALVNASNCTALGATIFDTCEIAIAAGAGEILANGTFLLLLDGGTAYDSYLTFAGVTFSPGASPPPPTTTGVPEPDTMALVGLALAGLVGMRKRKTSKR